MQLRAGYVLGGIRSALQEPIDGWHELLQPLTAFELDGEIGEVCVDDPLLAVADNIISRGMPALPSLRVEEALRAETGLTERHEQYGSLSFPLADALSSDTLSLLVRALCPIDPTVTAEEVMRDRGRAFGSDAERTFCRQALPGIVGPWALQVLEPQRPFETIVDKEQAHRFTRQQVDFAVELPLMDTRERGFVVEIDGAQYHREKGQRHLDSRRNAACRRADWKYARIAASNCANPPAEKADRIRDYLSGSYARQLRNNYEEPLHDSEQGRRWLKVALVPVLIARLQKTLLHLMRTGVLRMERDRWSIAVVERDIGGSRLAVEDLTELLNALFVLHGKGRSLPEINLHIIRSERGPSVGLDGEAADGLLEDEDLHFDADLVIDASVLLRPDLRTLTDEQLDRLGPHAVVATVRSSHSPRVEPVLAAGRPVRYATPPPTGDREVEEIDPDTEPQLAALVYFVRNLFRKKGFRPNQVDILCESLQGKDVIGLLPTGAGKSLTYQLSALLQPGISLVVAPLKSLMQDQHANLREAGIERVSFINSNLSTRERQEAGERLRRGADQFVFISPERLQMQEFRDTITSLECPIAYCVVDEAHCVSEWGHDFRTAYLRLGENARAFCGTLWGRLPIIALTGTASFDVLADVRRELQFGDETTTVTPESMERGELEFEVRHVPPPVDDLKEEDYWSVRETVIQQKMSALSHLMQEMPDWFDSEEEHFYDGAGSDSNSGLIFVPHANGAFGVEATAGVLTGAVPRLRGYTGTYASSNEDQDNDDLVRTQEEYKADRLTALVATKAFGMGIDKPNIRYVVHMNMSQSIESYYQEAGRAGRDKNAARCVILYCDQEVPEREHTLDHDLLLYFHEQAFKGAEAEKRFIYNLLKGEAYPESEEDDPDLEALLERMKPGGSSQVVGIDFASRKVIGTITSYLQEKVDGRFTEQIVNRAADRASDPGKFVKGLMGNFKKRYNHWPNGYVPDHEQKLVSWYGGIRDEQDTFRAVYRLSTVGVLSDYTVDYNAGVIRAEVKKRSVAGYIECVQEYIGRYVSPNKKAEIPNEILATRGENIIQKCLGYVIDFVYSSVARKRRNAMEVMEEALREGIEKGSDAFRQRVNTYFDSRYLPILQERVRDRSYSLDLVWEFMEETGGVDDEVQHLRGACDRLIGEYTENGALYLLRAFTRCLSDGRNEQAFVRDFRRGWDLFRESKALSREAYIEGLIRYKEEVQVYDLGVLDLLDAQIVEVHREWLHQFNTRFVRRTRPSSDTASGANQETQQAQVA